MGFTPGTVGGGVYGNAHFDGRLLRTAQWLTQHILEGALGLDSCPPPPVRLNPSLGEMELRWYPKLTRLVRRLPIGEGARRRLFRAYVSRARTGRLRPLIRFLGLFALRREGPRLPIANSTMERLRGHAECLRGRPHFDRYAEDYLL